ncbi:hypothetical protein LDENG_00003390 [Lucifuga dentata]|nr:hypothetical protein LDENG_00003390 [Lucifuga dentata]
MSGISISYVSLILQRLSCSELLSLVMTSSPASPTKQRIWACFHSARRALLFKRPLRHCLTLFFLPPLGLSFVTPLFLFLHAALRLRFSSFFNRADTLRLTDSFILK